MDISVRTGFRFQTSDLNVVFDHIQRFRATVAPLAQCGRLRFLAAHAAYVIDSAELTATRRRASVTPFAHALRELAERTWTVESGAERDVTVDFRVELDIFPFNDRIYGTIRTEQDDFRALWMRQPGIDDFAYASYDVPPEVNAAVWAERQHVWQSLWNPDGVFTHPVLHGFTAHCVGSFDERPQPAELLTLCPTREARADRVVHTLLAEEWIRQHAPRYRGRADETAARRSADEWVASEEGRHAAQARAAQLIPQLRALTVDDLIARRATSRGTMAARSAEH